MATAPRSAPTRRQHAGTHRRASRVAAIIACSLVATAGISACGGDGGGGSTTRFCQAVGDNSAELFGPLPEPLAAADVRQLIALVGSVGRSAPLEIEPDWDAWALTLETFYSDTDVEHIKAMGYASQRSALAIDAWLQANCGFGVGVPIGTLPVGNLGLAVPDTTPDQ